jgi:hypothetical protein
LEQSIEILKSPRLDIARTCHGCQVLICILYSSQLVSTFAKTTCEGLFNVITQEKENSRELVSFKDIKVEMGRPFHWPSPL